MFFFKKKIHLKDYIHYNKQQKHTIGFVPTMGALHHGHLSLIEKAKESCDIVVVSIFVNPTQFNNEEDLIKYPSTINEDIKHLISVNNNVLFYPSIVEIYPNGIPPAKRIDLGSLTNTMEGHFRPGHFDGMVQVVKRLLDIVEPDYLFMGQKDYQQAAIINKMLKIWDSSTSLTICPIVREEDGLAMSSRNVRLSEKQRSQAPQISQALKDLGKELPNNNISDIEKKYKEIINLQTELNVEYLTICDGITLKPIDNYNDSDSIVCCTAVYAGDIRLIDNNIYK